MNRGPVVGVVRSPRVTSKLGVVCATRLTGTCRTYSPDQRFWIAATGRGRYSDGSIIRGKPEHPPHDGQATLNPVVVLEVLSPSSEGDDEGEKRLDFQSLASLRAIAVAEIYDGILDASGRSLLR